MKLPLNIQVASLACIASFLLAGCKSEPKDKEKTGSEKTENVSPVPVFLEQMPAPPNDRFKTQVIDVASFADLYKNIGSNRTLRLKDGDMLIPEKWDDKSNVNAEVHYGLIVRGVSNMKIIGGKNSRLIQGNKMFKVLEFQKCDNILFENLIAGHEPEKGSCSASVFSFSECHDIFLDMAILYGSGYEGITAYKTQNLNCRKVIIHSCSFRILSLSQCQNVRFLECVFRDNNLPWGAGKLYLNGTDRVLFRKCSFTNNAAYVGEQTETPFFQVEDCLDLFMEDCSLTNNKARYLTLRDQDIKLVNTHSEGNAWDPLKTNTTAAKP